eukprot:CAMPEP_0171456730 /NCGR_PEP_ID=MMETSP0945-20130129/3094_1 /TAXON_ID=109269 /ORGANISM="Vaucheria litorea, Strain CCMP2940" /LENGTH=121 /DNA_ID=CAMNT_0011982201 /DNA_START=252 /DNA_END=617 /DNA_ORIENTATION=-
MNVDGRVRDGSGQNLKLNPASLQRLAEIGVSHDLSSNSSGKQKDRVSPQQDERQASQMARPNRPNVSIFRNLLLTYATEVDVDVRELGVGEQETFGSSVVIVPISLGDRRVLPSMGHEKYF